MGELAIFNSNSYNKNKFATGGKRTMKIIEKLIGVMDQKRAYREYKKRAAALPKEYNVVMKEMQSYIWNCGHLDGSFDLLCDLVALMEASAVEGKRVLDVTGNDVTAFCDELICKRQGRTWQDTMRKKYNDRIFKKLKNIGVRGNHI
jgi:DNA-binding ferritin-like protein (Dps family)